MLRTLKSYAIYVRTLDLDDKVHHRLVTLSDDLPDNPKKARELIGQALQVQTDAKPGEDFGSWQVLGYVPETTEMSDALWLKYCTHKEKGEPVFSCPADLLGKILGKLGLDSNLNPLPKEAPADQAPEGKADQVPEGKADQTKEAPADQGKEAPADQAKDKAKGK